MGRPFEELQQWEDEDRGSQILVRCYSRFVAIENCFVLCEHGLRCFVSVSGFGATQSAIVDVDGGVAREGMTCSCRIGTRQIG